MTKKIEKNFKYLRGKVRLDTKTAADKLNISLSLLYKVEQGYKKPGRDLIQKMAELYKCSTDEIFLALDITNKEKHCVAI